MRARAFTLIETLIAMGILVVVLGAGVTANRVVLNNSQGSEDRVQMESIADEGVALLKLMQRSTQGSGGFTADYIKDNQQNVQQWVVPYASETVTVADPATYNWCTDKISANGCNDLSSVVMLCGTFGTADTMDELFANSLVGDGSELIAVSNTPGRDQMYYSFTNRTSDTVQVSDGTSSCSTDGYEFYKRTMTLQLVSHSQQSLKDWFSGSGLVGANPENRLNNRMFRAIVSVEKFNNASVPKVTRAFMLNDYNKP